MSNKPLSAYDVLTKIRQLASNDIDDYTQVLIEKLSGIQYEEDESKITFEGAIAMAARIDALKDLLMDIHNAFKYEELEGGYPDEM